MIHQNIAAALAHPAINQVLASGEAWGVASVTNVIYFLADDRDSIKVLPFSSSPRKSRNTGKYALWLVRADGSRVQRFGKYLTKATAEGVLAILRAL